MHRRGLKYSRCRCRASLHVPRNDTHEANSPHRLLSSRCSVASTTIASDPLICTGSLCCLQRVSITDPHLDLPVRSTHLPGLCKHGCVSDSSERDHDARCQKNRDVTVALRYL